jgi:hypothetical protein
MYVKQKKRCHETIVAVKPALIIKYYELRAFLVYLTGMQIA